MRLRRPVGARGYVLDTTTIAHFYVTHISPFASYLLPYRPVRAGVRWRIL
jgi:hypothetical protein